MQTTQPDGFENQRGFWGIVIIFTAIGFIAVMLLELSLQFYLAGPDYHLPKNLQIPIFLFAAAPGLLFGLWYGKKQLNKQYWALTDSELACGASRQQVFLLASIEKIIVGLPTGLVGKVLGLDHLPARENSLILCFKDGSWLPLCLYPLPNGAAIMDELKERFKDRLVHDYDYSPEEIQRLRSRDINELIRPK